MKHLILISLLSMSIGVNAQKGYKEYEVCTHYEVYKGKKNHGKPYCVAWATVHEYKDARKDTTYPYLFSGGKIFSGDEYEVYQQLSERGKYIVDSLDEDGITTLDNMYLSYESMYMKPGRKIEKFRRVIGASIFVVEYLIYRTNNKNGYELKKEYEVK